MRKISILYALLLSVVYISCVEPIHQSAKAEETVPPTQPTVQTEQQIGDIYQNYTAEPKSQFQVDENLIIDYIVENGLECKRAENGLYYQIHQQGEGELLQRGSPVKADYRGYFLNGKTFDSSYDRGKPIRFTVGQMAKGWDQGMTYLSRGSKVTLILPSFLGYGEEGFQNLVPPNSVLVFDIDIKKEAY